jgi:glycerol kinase
LPVSAYFTLFKILWLIENVEAVRLAVEEKAKFGTIDSWVIFNLSGEYVTNASNASRTYLCNLKGEWDEELISITGIKECFRK